MATLTQQQIDALKKKGLTDAKIRVLASKNGFDLPNPSTTQKVVGALTRSERGFGQSIAGAIGGTFPSLAGGDAVAQSNALSEQVKQNAFKAIQEKRARGEDTTKLLNALKTLDSEVNFYDILNQSTGGSLDKTGRQVFGEGLGVATDIIGAGTLPGGVGTAAKATSFGQGIRAGARAGATGGAIFGSAQGVARAAQDDKTAGQIVGEGIQGGVVGGVAGGVIGGAIGGASGAIAGRKNTNKVLDYVTPTADELTPKQYREALSKGLVTPKTATAPSKYVLPKAQQQAALKYSDIISKDPVKTAIKISEKVGTLDDSVGAFLKQNNGIYNKGELRNHLTDALSEISDVTVDPARMDKLQTDLVKRFTESLDKGDMWSLWQARKAFDSKIGNAFKGSPTIQKEIQRTFRNSVQDFIAERTPDEVYRAYMLDMSNLIRLRDDSVAVRAVKERGLDAIRLWFKNHPKTAKVGGWGILLGVGTQVPRAFD